MIRARLALIALPALLAGALAHAGPAARLEMRGCSLTSRECATLFAGALRSPRDSAATLTALGALVGRLQSLGYLDARAGAQWDTAAAPLCRVEVDEGARYRFREVAIDAPSAADSARIAGALGVIAGEIASPTALRARIERAVDAVSGDAWPYAVIGVGGWQADSSGVRLRVSGALGPRVTVSDVRVDGLRVTRRDVAMRALGRLAGRPYRRSEAEDARDRLEALGLFRSVEFRGLEGESEWSRAQLVYRVEEPRYNAFEGAVGVQGRAGTVGLARLELNNVLGTGRSLALRWESRGRGVSQFGVRGGEPQVLGLPLRLEGHAEQDVQDTLFVRTRWGARVVFALSGRQHVEAGYEAERVVQEHELVEEANLDNTVFAFESNGLDAAVGPRRGMKLRVGATEVFKRERLRPSGERTARASAADLRLEWHRPLSGQTGADLELQAAGRFGRSEALPFYERSPLGGTSTLRGYDEDQFRVDRFALSRLEWSRFLGPGGSRAFLFWDHATMSTRSIDASGNGRTIVASRDGFGFGLRLPAAGGLVGLDYGLAAGRPPLEGKLHLRLVSQF